jgi:four helix bundle protein
MKENIIKIKSLEFAINIVGLYKQLKEQQEYIISKQILRSGTSIGANVAESESAQSKADFISKLSIAAKEARETKYWLTLLQESKLATVEITSHLSQIEEILKILTSIIKTSQQNGN